MGKILQKWRYHSKTKNTNILNLKIHCIYVQIKLKRVSVFEEVDKCLFPKNNFIQNKKPRLLLRTQQNRVFRTSRL